MFIFILIFGIPFSKSAHPCGLNSAPKSLGRLWRPLERTGPRPKPP